MMKMVSGMGMANMMKGMGGLGALKGMKMPKF
jgi:hypothetical protein